ncbi:hypothetical protein [Caballeronia zhejiangensis]|uniref:Uncharacterized protein n=1 Tax=Caballeronia zhejiangensis TaxID=871203 RepID=A0A656QFZ8_9BURK|nr:hypothetical protein [Caballeronia zhejiangensis]KDR25986.1 hypothetical protein BG60_26290 [Caballeronia zhejiangensis]
MSQSTIPVEPEGKPLQQAFSKRPRFTQEQIDAYRRYKCPSCQATHKHEWAAESCCAPAVDEVFVCPECDDTFDTMEQAMACEGAHAIAC